MDYVDKGPHGTNGPRVTESTGTRNHIDKESGNQALLKNTARSQT